MRIKVNKKKITCFAMAILVLVMSITRNGNYNLLYFAFPIIFVLASVKNKKFIHRVLKVFWPFLTIFFTTYLFSPWFNSTVKSLIYLLKVFICIVWFCGIRELSNEDQYKYFVNYLSNGILFLTMVAFIFRDNLFWRFNDSINGFSTTRLQLLFSEPSELSEICGLLILSLYYFYRIDNNKKALAKIILLLIPILQSGGLSGIVYSFVCLVLLIILFENRSIAKGRMSKIAFFSFLVLIVSVIYIIIGIFHSNNLLLQRINAILSGNDASFNYRYNLAIELLGVVLLKTHFVGVGLGNLRTSEVTNRLLLYNRSYTANGFANSYMFFFAEGGILAIIFVVGFILFEAKSIKEDQTSYDNKKFRISVLIYIVIMQITGGYFTDPFIWVIYGLIAGYIGKSNFTVSEVTR